MRYFLVAGWLFALMAVSGCTTITSEEKKTIATARNACSYVDLSRGSTTLKLAVKAGGTTLPEQMLKTQNAALPEAEVFKAVLQQQLCILSMTMPSFPPGTTSDWEKEVSKAFDAWKPVKADARLTELDAIRKAETAHVEEIGRKPGTSAAPMSPDLFMAAVPVMDFLSIVEINLGVKLGSNSTFKGVSLNDSEGKIEYKSNEFSNAIRPSLNRIRVTLAQYALKQITDVQAQQALVHSVYDAAAGRYAGLTK
jgi:hypothetical protein